MHYQLSRRYFWGALVCLLGIAFLLDSLDVLDIGDFVSHYWPLILIIIGLKIILGRRPHKDISVENVEYTEESDRINFSHTFGDIRMKYKSQEFSGGYISNVFGNIEVDLDEISLKTGEYDLVLRGVFGDLIIITPKKVPIKIIAGTTFGSTRVKGRNSEGMGDKIRYISDGYSESPVKLNIDANQVFGDVRIF